jgi:dTMP kinase
MRSSGEGKFVVLEGISGSGKSTQAKILSARLPNAVLNVEPTYDLFGAVVRAQYMGEKVSEEVLTNCFQYKHDQMGFWPSAHHIISKIQHGLKLAENEMQFLFMADRVYDLEKNVFSNLALSKLIIQDRYLGSTLAYGYSGGLDIDELLKWQKFAFESSGITDESWVPDLMVIFDLDSKIAMERLQSSGKPIDMYEQKLERLQKIREGYQILAKRTDIARKIVVLNATREQEEITAQLMELISSELGSAIKTA